MQQRGRERRVDAVASPRAHATEVSGYESGPLRRGQQEIIRAQISEDRVGTRSVESAALARLDRAAQDFARRVRPPDVDFPLRELEGFRGEVATGQCQRAFAQLHRRRIPPLVGEDPARELPEQPARLHFRREKLRDQFRARLAAGGQEIDERSNEERRPLAARPFPFAPDPARQRRIIFQPQAGQEKRFLGALRFVGRLLVQPRRRQIENGFLLSRGKKRR